jgi:hypothetical protein
VIHGLDNTPVDERPEWAARLRLPTRDTLAYTQSLLVAGALGFAALYLAARTMRHPSTLLRAARAKTGV